MGKNKLVPMEPTPEMLAAGKHALEVGCYASGIYADMLAAAPVVQGEPVAWLRFRSHRVAADDVIEGLEICEPGETGDDGGPAFPVYVTPQPAEQVERWRHDAEDLEALHHNLDDAGTPRHHSSGAEYSAWGRVIQYATAAAPHPVAAQGEPVYLYRRRGLDDFVTCDFTRYTELSGKTNLFETKILYTATQPAGQPQLPLPDFITDPDDSDEGASLWDHGFKQGWNSCLEAVAEDMQHTEQRKILDAEVTAESLVPLSDYQKLLDKCGVLVKDLELLLRRLEKMPRKLWLKEQLETILTTLALEDEKDPICIPKDKT